MIIICIPTSSILVVVVAAAVVVTAMLLPPPPPSPRILQRLSHLYSTPTTRSYHHFHHPSIFQSHPRPSSSIILMLGNTITTTNLVMTGCSYDGRISSKLLVPSWSIATSSSSSSHDYTPCDSRLRNSRSIRRSSSSSSSSSSSQEPPVVQDRYHAHNNNNNCRHPESMDPIWKVDQHPQVNHIATPDVPTRDTTTTISTTTTTTTSAAIPSQRWFVAKHFNKRTRQRISNVFSIVGFISSATRSLLWRTSPTLIRQQYQDTVQALRSFLQSTQIDLELVPVLNHRLLDNLIWLSICEAIIIHRGRHDRRDEACVTPTVDTTTTTTLAAATTVTASSTIATTTMTTTKTQNNHVHTDNVHDTNTTNIIIPTFADALR
jgi:hypothetical protein